MTPNETSHAALRTKIRGVLLLYLSPTYVRSSGSVFSRLAHLDDQPCLNMAILGLVTASPAQRQTRKCLWIYHSTHLLADRSALKW